MAQQRREFLATDRSSLDVMARLRIAMKQNDFGETVLSTQSSATFYATGLMSSLFGTNVTVTAIPEGMDTRLIVLADVMLGSRRSCPRRGVSDSYREALSSAN